MIPKKIHYCWFGKGEKPAIVNKCINSWKRYLPDYEIIEWNEENFDVNKLIYTKEAYEAKKYAFVSDVARVNALYEQGGLYFDTDVIVYKSFDPFLNHSCVLGFEEGNYVATSFMACEKGHKLMKEFCLLYDEISFYDEEGNIITGTNVSKLTRLMIDKGLIRNNMLQNIDGIVVFPQEFFSPYDYCNCIKQNTENTVCEHLFLVSWMSKKEKIKKMIKKNISRIFGKKGITKIRNILNKVRL